MCVEVSQRDDKSALIYLFVYFRTPKFSLVYRSSITRSQLLRVYISIFHSHCNILTFFSHLQQLHCRCAASTDRVEGSHSHVSHVPPSLPTTHTRALLHLHPMCIICKCSEHSQRSWERTQRVAKESCAKEESRFMIYVCGECSEVKSNTLAAKFINVEWKISAYTRAGYDAGAEVSVKVERNIYDIFRHCIWATRQTKLTTSSMKTAKPTKLFAFFILSIVLDSHPLTSPSPISVGMFSFIVA